MCVKVPNSRAYPDDRPGRHNMVSYVMVFDLMVFDLMVHGNALFDDAMSLCRGRHIGHGDNRDSSAQNGFCEHSRADNRGYTWHFVAPC
jgi:hypothetical protein